VSVRIGTCSWADESLSKLWYPASARSAEGRLRYYAEHFDTVEVNATYYGMPSAQMAANWAKRTPDDFLFHVKAFAMMTRHPATPEQLPPDLREHFELDERGHIAHPPRELRGAVFQRFLNEIEPLREAGKLGGILMQFPPYVVFKPQSFEYLTWAREQLSGYEMLVEFRHHSWLEPDVADGVLDFLSDLDATYVMVDAPRDGAKNVLPTVVATTSETAYVRMHGRNAATWNVRGRSAAERFDHLYSDEELQEWVEPLRELEAANERVFVMFNNNGRSVDAVSGQSFAQAPANALTLIGLLADAGIPVENTTAR
jgi:uncharacterized protein YecE (DUF72 family)